LNMITKSKFVLVTIGTPIDEHLGPRNSDIYNLFNDISPYLVDGQIVILRSTVLPGTSKNLNRIIHRIKAKVSITFCPERIAEGKALQELEELPQIVSGFDDHSINEVCQLFRNLTSEVIVLDPMEAELAKLYTNAWRYIQFAVANYFYVVADKIGLNYHRIYKAITYRYPRAAGLPGPGFTAGPCLLKDTMQLLAFTGNTFYLGQAAMLINEWLPNYIVDKLKANYDLSSKNVGILGMSFKAESDDERDSLSFKLKKLLEFEVAKLYCSDPYVKRDYFVEPEELLEHSDIIIIATPHDRYRRLKISKDKILIDIWNIASHYDFNTAHLK